jgi:transcriptional regulator with XRE-family HTH domain
MQELIIDDRRVNHRLNRQTLGPRNLKNLRKRLKLTQSAAAALVRVDPNTWARWERGESRPRGLLHREAIASLPRLARQRLRARSSEPGPRPVRGEGSVRRFSTASDLLKHAGTWVGSDLENCLELVYATRSRVKF